MKILFLVIDGLVLCAPGLFTLMKRVTCRKSEMIKWCSKCYHIHDQDFQYCTECGSQLTWARSSEYENEWTIITEKGFIKLKPSKTVEDDVIKATVNAAKTVKLCCTTLRKATA